MSVGIGEGQELFLSAYVPHFISDAMSWNFEKRLEKFSNETLKYLWDSWKHSKYQLGQWFFALYVRLGYIMHPNLIKLNSCKTQEDVQLRAVV